MPSAIPQHGLPTYGLPQYGLPGLSNTPILERIALWHAETLAEITTDNGYHQTLDVTRPEAIVLSGETITDMTTICSLGVCEEESNPTMEHYFWNQIFSARVYLLDAATTGLSVDTRITQIIGDIHKRIGEELANGAETGGRYCNGLAYSIDPLPWQIFVDEQLGATVVDVPMRIAFVVLRADPCSQ